MTPEFSRPERVDQIGEREREVVVEADPAERAALARRFGLVEVGRLTARLAVRRTGSGVAVRGRVEAAVVQACSATGDPLPAVVDEPVDLLFVAQADAAGPHASDEEAELSADALDTLPIENGAVDLGEAAAETMALALDPFPRSPAAAGALRAAGVLEEGEVRPATGLAGLGDLLAKR